MCSTIKRAGPYLRKVAAMKPTPIVCAPHPYQLRRAHARRVGVRRPDMPHGLPLGCWWTHPEGARIAIADKVVLPEED